MRVAVGLRLFSDDGADTSAVVVEAERLGVDFVWSAEGLGYDAVRPSARSVRIPAGETLEARVTTLGSLMPRPSDADAQGLTSARRAP